MATRREFLSQAGHRIRFVYLPKHSSWLNQIESISGINNRKALRRASFTSVAQLQTRILDFIDYLNRTMAKPFNWTYTGRPVASKSDDRPRTWLTLPFSMCAGKTGFVC
jgi:transposase